MRLFCRWRGTCWPAGAAWESQLNLDVGLQQYFSGSGNELYYVGIRIEYTAFQDDIGKPSGGVHMTKIGFMFEDKGLEAHPDKTSYIIVKGNKKDVMRIEKGLEINPIRFNQFTM